MRLSSLAAAPALVEAQCASADRRAVWRRTALDAGLTKLTATGADVVLMDNQLSPRIEAAPGHEVYGAAIARDAAKHHDSLFPRAELMQEWQAAGANDLIGPDGLHHSDRGYACVAAVLAQAIVDAVKVPVKLATGTNR